MIFLQFILVILLNHVSLGQLQISRQADLFKHPFIVEVTGAGFDKLPNTNYFTLRFPRILKIHQDRTLNDTVSYDELQELAKRAMEPLSGGESEESCWLEKLQRANLESDFQIVPTSDTAERDSHVTQRANTSRKQKLLSGDSPRLAPPAKRVKSVVWAGINC